VSVIPIYQDDFAAVSKKISKKANGKPSSASTKVVGMVEEAFSGKLDDETGYKVSWSQTKIKGKYLHKECMFPSEASSGSGSGGGGSDGDSLATAVVPIWYPLQFGGATIEGSLFISVSISRMPPPPPMSTLALQASNTNANENASAQPLSLDSLKYQDATITILALGCRSLCKDSFSPIEMPYVEFKLDPHFLREGNEVMPVTEPSRDPSATDPNFCTQANPYLPYYRLPVRLPEDRRFTPVLNVIVRDRRFGGLSRPIIGTVRIPLTVAEGGVERGGRLVETKEEEEEEAKELKEEKVVEDEEKQQQEKKAEEQEYEGSSGGNDGMNGGQEWWKARRPFLDEELETTLSGVHVEIVGTGDYTGRRIINALMGKSKSESEGQREGAGKTKGKGKGKGKRRGKDTNAGVDEDKSGSGEVRLTGRLASGAVPAFKFDSHTNERILDPNETYAVMLDECVGTSGSGGCGGGGGGSGGGSGGNAKRVVNIRGKYLKLDQSVCPLESFQLTRYKQASTFAQMRTKYNALGSSRRSNGQSKSGFTRGRIRSTDSDKPGGGGDRRAVGVFKGMYRAAAN
jgi:hypothetical protein